MSQKTNSEQVQLRDPVCDMSVSSESEYAYDYADKQNLFCSEHCLQKFKENPEQYLDKKLPHHAKQMVSQIPTPAPCIRKSFRIIPAIAPSAGWRWSGEEQKRRADPVEKI